MSVLPVGFGSAAGGTPAGAIERSLRFNSADTAYLNRTLGSSNRRTFTFSAWVKRSVLTGADSQTLFGCINTSGGVNQQFGIQLQANETLVAFHFNSVDSTYFPCATSAVYRDPSSWYHIVVAIDTTQATNTNRCKIYVNGSEQTLNSPSYPTQNLDLFVNSGLSTGIGAQVGTGTSNLRYLGGYLTEINFIDGQALTPSSFGETDTNTGVWKPKAYSSTYGTNGFYLKFADNSGTTSTTLGKDSSGNGNNWTPNNFSVTAGAGNDSLVDSPTAYGTDTGVGGEVRGNYCTLNPLDEPSTYAAVGTPVNGNLDFSVSNDTAAGATFAVSSGKWYWEMTVVSGHTAGANTAWAAIASSTPSSVNKLPNQSGSGGRAYATTGSKFNENTSSSYGNTYTNGDVIGCALDLDNGKVYWSKNGTFQASGDPVAGTNAAFTGLTGTWLPVAFSNTPLTSFNFGQRAFAYTAPSGFKALVTTNLPTPTIGATSTTQANDYFNAVTYTGNGSNPRTITGVGFQPDLVWGKTRNQTRNHCLFDAVRGVGSTRALFSNLTDVEGGGSGNESSAYGCINAFTSDGFTVNAGTINNNYWNTNNDTYVGWVWNAGGSTVTNTSGTISAQVRANTTSGFSIVTYTGTGTAATIGHGLGVVPNMVIVKVMANGGANTAWHVYHSSLANTDYLSLNTTAAKDTGSIWNNTSPTSSVFSIGSSTWPQVNNNTGTYVAYCFAPVAGYSAFGSYTGNAAADGPFIYTGFRPEFVMIKASSSTGDWVMQDVARSPSNVSTNYLVANASTAEQTGQLVDFLSNGFKIRVAVSGAMNGSGTTYVYAAFAESPFKHALAR